MKFDFPKKIRSGYLVVFLLLVLCYFLSLSSFIQLRKQNRWVGHTRDVITKLGMLNAKLKDAEINWHDYLLSKQEMYLEAYDVAGAVALGAYMLWPKPPRPRLLDVLAGIVAVIALIGLFGLAAHAGVAIPAASALGGSAWAADQAPKAATIVQRRRAAETV